jgi:two-component system, LuxR family, response regulator FixJ
MTPTPQATVFIVDDDEAIRDSLLLLIEAEGLVARAFPSAGEFLAEVGNTSPGVVIADVRMPGLTGIDLLGRLRERATKLPVILITGHGDVPMAVGALKAGAADFFEKPFDEEQLLTSLRDALSQADTSYRRDAAVAELRTRYESLTAREQEVMGLIVEGHSNKVIAVRLAISPRTVEIHRARVMDKMQARNLSDLVRMSLRLAEQST